MIDYDKLKTHPLIMVIAKIEAHIMGIKEQQIELITMVANDLGYSADILCKAMNLASRDMEAKECQHEYKKTVTKSGEFINMCHKCWDKKPWRECEHETDTGHRLSYTGQFKCKKCGEFYK